jgi:hypothetical protein
MMKPYLLLLLLPLFSFYSTNDCGKLRWDYKILIDQKGLLLFNKAPQQASLKELDELDKPAVLGNQRSDEENRKVMVTAFIVAIGKEPDRDYHLVLKTADGNTSLVAEIPDPTCSKLKGFPGLKSAYAAARKFVDDNIKKPTSSIKTLPHRVKVTITGIPFFDISDHGEGHSDNGVEIHPVLKIKKA